MIHCDFMCLQQINLQRDVLKKDQFCAQNMIIVPIVRKVAYGLKLGWLTISY